MEFRGAPTDTGVAFTTLGSCLHCTGPVVFGVDDSSPCLVPQIPDAFFSHSILEVGINTIVANGLLASATAFQICAVVQRGILEGLQLGPLFGLGKR